MIGADAAVPENEQALSLPAEFMTTVYFLEAGERGRELSALGERLIRAAAGRILGVEPGSCVIDKEENGKPYLRDGKDFHFNLSHTVGAVVLAVSSRPVGVDVERIRPANRKLASRFFTEGEQRYLESGELDVDRLFFEVWTRKEAFLKQTGKGIRVALNSFDVLTGESAEMLRTIEYQGFVLSCCSEGWQGNVVTVMSGEL